MTKTATSSYFRHFYFKHSIFSDFYRMYIGVVFDHSYYASMKSAAEHNQRLQIQMDDILKYGLFPSISLLMHRVLGLLESYNWNMWDGIGMMAEIKEK